jgi:hypothetical protein
MGFSVWKFALHRLADIVIPGSGIVMDAVDAYDALDALVSANDIDVSDMQDLKAAIDDAKQNGRQISADLFAKKVRRCGICRKPGHNRRTCPNK